MCDITILIHCATVFRPKMYSPHSLMNLKNVRKIILELLALKIQLTEYSIIYLIFK